MSTQVELPVVGRQVESRPAAAPIGRERYDELARKVKRLSWLSLGAMTVEGALAITAGVIAGSIALVGFGLDSAVEGFASTIIIWRFTRRPAAARLPSWRRRGSRPVAGGESGGLGEVVPRGVELEVAVLPPSSALVGSAGGARRRPGDHGRRLPVLRSSQRGRPDLAPLPRSQAAREPAGSICRASQRHSYRSSAANE